MGGAQSVSQEKVRQLYAELKQTWDSDRESLTRWMAGKMDAYASWRDQNGGVLGNTEGWGAVGWDEVPALNWSFIAEAAEFCVELARSRKYMFICTSNFTHPHFRELWRDVSWHQKITASIRERY